MRHCLKCPRPCRPRRAIALLIAAGSLKMLGLSARATCTPSIECARQESNLRPFAPEANALSPELRARGSRDSVALPPGRKGPPHAGPSARSVAGVVRVVHVVVDRVDPGLATAVLPPGQPRVAT